LANRLRKVIRSCSPDSHSPISGSLGISLFPEHGNTPSGLVRFADLAMYQSKSRSGDCQLFYDPGMKFAQLNPLPRDTALPQVKRRQFQSVTTQQ
jgi:GGDEF domain-containing protein